MLSGKNTQKKVKCKACGEYFERVRSLQIVCSVKCASDRAHSQIVKEKAKALREERRNIKIKLDAMRTLPQLIKAAQSAFNAYIRARDAGKECISCSNPLPREAIGGAFDCGHYRSIGSAPHLRFDERNAHGQCKHCNRYLSGNHVEYRKRLAMRIGADALEALESDKCVKKYSKDELSVMAAEYRRMAREVKRSQNQAQVMQSVSLEQKITSSHQQTSGHLSI